MVEVYVDWNQLKSSVRHLKSYSKRINNYTGKVDSINSNLHITDAASAGIHDALSKCTEKMGKLTQSLNQLSEVLAEVSNKYKTTEENLLENNN